MSRQKFSEKRLGSDKLEAIRRANTIIRSFQDEKAE